jgi:hypothetical protein
LSFRFRWQSEPETPWATLNVSRRRHFTLFTNASWAPETLCIRFEYELPVIFPLGPRREHRMPDYFLHGPRVAAGLYAFGAERIEPSGGFQIQLVIQYAP